jgi:hypothetical protein
MAEKATATATIHCLKGLLGRIIARGWSPPLDANNLDVIEDDMERIVVESMQLDVIRHTHQSNCQDSRALSSFTDADVALLLPSKRQGLFQLSAGFKLIAVPAYFEDELSRALGMICSVVIATVNDAKLFCRTRLGAV